MTFLAPWALGVGAMGALGMVLLHLVAWQRPAAYVLPTTRFIPDQRTVVSRAATRPRDVLLLLIRVLMLLAAATAFARPVLTPSTGSTAHVVLLDRSRAVADAAGAVARARAAVSGDASAVLIAFDSVARELPARALDSLASAPATVSNGSISAGLALARRRSTELAEHADSVRLTVVSPVAATEVDAATPWLRAHWPGAIALERVPVRSDSSGGWHLDAAIPVDDALGPATLALRSGGALVTRVIHGAPRAADSAFARAGGTVVQWDTSSQSPTAAMGVSVGNDVVVGMLGRSPVGGNGRVLARWADGEAAARETALGSGCLRQVGIVVPRAGDLALHAPFQRTVRTLLTPCGWSAPDVASDSSTVRTLFAAGPAAPSRALRDTSAPPTPFVKWLLALALALALLELAVRSRGAVEAAP